MSSGKRLTKRMSSMSSDAMLASPSLAAAGAGAAPPPLSSRGVAVGSGASAAASITMSAADVRGGLDLLRGQVAALHLENDALKAGRAALERERAQDLRYMRALLGRSQLRHHAQSFKMRRLLVQLHARVLDLAAVLNKEQKISEARDNTVASVQEGDGETEAAAESIANQQRAHFLGSLTRLRPIRVGLALQENMERLFESVGDVVARCPRYRSELDYNFGRLVQLKQQLLSCEGERRQSDQRCGELEVEMRALVEQTEQFRAKNEELTRDMQTAIDAEKKRRLRDNAAKIKARTTLYKQILADKDSPLHPAHLAKVGKNGTNLNSLANSREQKRASLNSGAAPMEADAPSPAAAAAAAPPAVDRKAAAQQAYYLQRRQAHDQQKQDPNAETAEEADGSSEEQQQQQQAGESDYPDVECSDGSAGGAPPAGRHGPSRSEDISSYMCAFEPSPRDSSGSSLDTDEKEQVRSVQQRERTHATATATVLPSIAQSQPQSLSQSQSQTQSQSQSRLASSASAPALAKLSFPLPFSLSPLRAKPSAAYLANARAEAAYRSSNEHLRHLAHEYTHHRFVNIGPAAAAAAAASTAGTAATPAATGSSSPVEGASAGPRPQYSKKESLLHPSPSLSFGSAQRIFAQRVGVGGNHGSHSPSSIAHAAPWVSNFASPADSAHHSPSAPSAALPRVLGALDDLRSQAAFHASERRVHEGALAPRPANIASPPAHAHAAPRKIKTHSSHSSLGAAPVSPAHENGNGHGASAARAFSAGPSLSSANASPGTDDSRDMMALARKYASPASQKGGGGGDSVSISSPSKPARATVTVTVSRRAPTAGASPSANQRKHAAAAADHADASSPPQHTRLIIEPSPRREAGLF